MSDELGKGWFRHDFAFGREAEDLNGHVNNIEYVRVMQDVAILHVEALGVGMEWLRERGWTWVVRKHEIEYLKPCHAGEALQVYTWVEDFHRFRSRRRYRFVRAEDGAVLAEAETEWIFVDFEKGRVRSIPEEVLGRFSVTGEGARPERPEGVGVRS